MMYSIVCAKWFLLFAGILDPDEKPDEDPDDEILNELRRKQSELRVLSQHNLMFTKRLYKLAKEEMAQAGSSTKGRRSRCRGRNATHLHARKFHYFKINVRSTQTLLIL